MRVSLVLIALAASTAALAQGRLPAVQQVSDARTATTATTPPRPAVRQLSAEERAELRRQLYQFSRLHGKGS